MSKQLDKINKLEEGIRKMEQEVRDMEQEYFDNDGKIDKEEQREINELITTVKTVAKELLRRKAALPPEITRAVFLAGTYQETNYRPPTGRGLFDISLNPKSGRIEVLTKMDFQFIDGKPARFTGLAGQQAAWTDAEKTTWRRDFVKLIEGRWGAKYYFVHPDMPGEQFFVDVEIEQADAQWHYQPNITKVPKGIKLGSSVSRGPAAPERMQAILDSNDLSWHKRQGDNGNDLYQKPAVHEYGHMVGLDDEYKGEGGIQHDILVKDALGTILVAERSTDVMSIGNQIEKQHYVTFLQALKDITKLNKWTFKN